jgi:hypothetical protein
MLHSAGNESDYLVVRYFVTNGRISCFKSYIRFSLEKLLQE